MYRKDVEGMPHEIKRELIKCTSITSVNDIVSVSEMGCDLHGSSPIAEAIIKTDLPDFWIVADKAAHFDDNTIYVVFKTSLSSSQEEMFLDALPDNLLEKVNIQSFSDKYGIY